MNVHLIITRTDREARKFIQFLYLEAQAQGRNDIHFHGWRELVSENDDRVVRAYPVSALPDALLGMEISGYTLLCDERLLDEGIRVALESRLRRKYSGYKAGDIYVDEARLIFGGQDADVDNADK